VIITLGIGAHTVSSDEYWCKKLGNKEIKKKAPLTKKSSVPSFHGVVAAVDRWRWPSV
jgi:hypothetical protein